MTDRHHLDTLGDALAHAHDDLDAHRVDALREDHDTIIALGQRARHARRRRHRLQLVALAVGAIAAALAAPALLGQRDELPDDRAQAGLVEPPYNRAAAYLSDLVVDHDQRGGQLTLVLAQDRVHRFALAPGDSATVDAILGDALGVSQINETLFLHAKAPGRHTLSVAVHRSRERDRGDVTLIEPASRYDATLRVVVVEAKAPRLGGQPAVVERQLTLDPPDTTLVFDRLSRLPIERQSSGLKVERDREHDRLEVRALRPGRHELHLRRSASMPALRIVLDRPERAPR